MCIRDRHKTVEAILAEAALANAQLAVAKAVLKAEFRREGATAEEAAAKADEAVEKMATRLVFGRAPVGAKARKRQGKPEVQVLYFRNLDDEQGDVGYMMLPGEQPVQLSMFAS